MGVAIFIGISIASAVIWHYFVSRHQASMAAAITSAILFQLVVYLDLGHLDSFFIVALFASGCLAYLISFVVGLLMQRHLKNVRASK